MIGHLIRAINWLGSQGTRAIAASLFIGMALPPLSALLKPFIPHAVFLLLLVAFMRVDTHAVWRRIRRPWLVLAIIGWMMIVVPLGFGALLNVTGFAAAEPDILVAFVLLSIAPPIMSAPGITYLLGLDGALSLAVLVAGIVATPVLCPLIAGFLLGDALPISSLDLAYRLAALLSCSMIVAMILRWFAGTQRIEKSARLFDGANVLLLFVFAVAIMDGVAVRLFAEPFLVIGLLIAAFVIAIVFIGTTTLLFLKAGLDPALTIGIACGNRNMALMAAALASVIPDVSWVFIAVAQVPIYLLPWLMKPVIERLVPPAGNRAAQ